MVLASIALALTILPAPASLESAALVRKSNVYRNSGDYPQALKYLRSALRSDPNEPTIRRALTDVYRSYGTSLEKKGDYEGAIRELHMALYINPKDSDSKLDLDRVLQSAGTDPASYQARLQLAARASSRGNYIDAVVEDRYALSLHDDESVRTSSLAAIQSRMKDPDYLPEFDMKVLPGAGVDSLLTRARELIDRQYILRAQTTMDTASAIAPGDPLVIELQQKLEAARTERARMFLKKAEEAERQGQKLSALNYYLEVRELHKEDSSVAKRITELKDVDDGSFGKKCGQYARNVEKLIKKNWAVRRNIPPGRNIALFRIQQDGSVGDVILTQKSGSKTLD